MNNFLDVLISWGESQEAKAAVITTLGAICTLTLKYLWTYLRKSYADGLANYKWSDIGSELYNILDTPVDHWQIQNGGTRLLWLPDVYAGCKSIVFKIPRLCQDFEIILNNERIDIYELPGYEYSMLMRKARKVFDAVCYAKNEKTRRQIVCELGKLKNRFTPDKPSQDS